MANDLSAEFDAVNDSKEDNTLIGFRYSYTYNGTDSDRHVNSLPRRETDDNERFTAISDSTDDYNEPGFWLAGNEDEVCVIHRINFEEGEMLELYQKLDTSELSKSDREMDEEEDSKTLYDHVYPTYLNLATDIAGSTQSMLRGEDLRGPYNIVADESVTAPYNLPRYKLEELDFVRKFDATLLEVQTSVDHKKFYCSLNRIDHMGGPSCWNYDAARNVYNGKQDYRLKTSQPVGVVCTEEGVVGFLLDLLP